MIEVFGNKYFVIGVVVLVGALIYHLVSRRDKFVDGVDKEYNDLLNSDKHKVKSQYEE